MEGSIINRFAFAVFAIAAAFGSTNARADLMLHPTRIAFEGNRRSAQLEVINQGTETEVYRIRVERKRMTDSGEFVTVESPLAGEQFADDLIRYSPRQIELAPGASQAVRLMLRKPAQLATGEYRSHLVFERIPNVGIAADKMPVAGARPDLSIQLVPLVNVSIPLIVRHGETSASVSIADLRLEALPDRAPTLSLTLQRAGNRSTYGDLVVYSIPNNKHGKPEVIARIGGVAVYAPNALRRAQLTLPTAARTRLAIGTLRVAYQERPEDGGELLAERLLQLP